LMRLYLPPWRIDIERRAGVPRLVSQRVLAAQVAAVLDVGGAPRPAVVGLTLSTDRELAELNATHMGHQGPTDVLSFPLLPLSEFPEHDGQGRSRRAAGGAPAFALPPGRRVHLGEIVVSVERAIEQAREGRGGQTGDVRWTPADELLLLVTHGTLHLCGWDHERPAEEAAMRQVEQRLLAAP
jgi:rRNA maturation RNase YbeY